MQIKLLIFFFLRNFFFVRDENFEKITNLRCNHLSSKKKTETKHTHLQTFFFSSEFFYCERPSSQRIVTPVVDTPTSCHAHRLGSLAVSAKKKTEICWWFFSCTFRVCVCVCYFAAIFFFFWKKHCTVCVNLWSPASSSFWPGRGKYKCFIVWQKKRENLPLIFDVESAGRLLTAVSNWKSEGMLNQ